MSDLENLKNDDQLLSMMEEMQDQIEDLQNRLQKEVEKNSEAQKKISQLSSQISMLKNEVQKKSERIEKMNESDLILKKNAELEKKIIEAQNKEKKTREEAEIMVAAVKEKAKKDVEDIQSEYKKRVASLDQRKEKIENRELILSARESDFDGEISRKADGIVRKQVMELGSKLNNKIKDLEKEYQKKTDTVISKYNNMIFTYRGRLFFILFYSILTTIITAFKTDALVTDFIACIMAIKNYAIVLEGWISIVAIFIARLGDMIPQEVVATIVHWILVITVSVTIIGGIGWLIFILGRKYVKFFKDKQADEISVFVGIIVLAITIFMADTMKSILSINLFYLMSIVFVGYTVVRGIVQAENIEAKKKILKYAGIMVGCVVVVVAIGYFFGPIGIIAVPIGCLLSYSERI